MTKTFWLFLFSVPALFLTACDQAAFSHLKDTISGSIVAVSPNKKSEGPGAIKNMDTLTEGFRAKVQVNAAFEKVMHQALDQDPDVLAAQNEVAVSKAKLLSTKAGRDFKIQATVLGGVEDVTDETVGVAAILSANRMLYDGGILDAQIDSYLFYSKAAEQSYFAVRGKRALRLSYLWIELERYQALNNLIDNRLDVLDPLLVQLEEVATAGIGDVSQVAEAQRIVSSILVAESNILERYEQSKIAFVSGFGSLPLEARYNAAFISKGVPTANVKEIAKKSPGILAKYWAYRGAEAAVVVVEAQDKFSIGFEAKLQQPLGGSGFNSDESIGLVLSKKFYRGDQLTSQVQRAEATALASAAQVASVYREGERMILTAGQMIKSMDKAIQLAKNNAKSLREEIEFLRKQLIIGGSTLKSVLSAEARLFEAESKEIGFLAERRKAEITIASISGYFSQMPNSN